MKYKNEELLAMYRSMVLSRQYCQTINKLCMQGKIVGMHHLGLGEEATGVGIRFAMKPDDWYIPQHRQHSGMLYGADLKKYISEKMCKVTGYGHGIATDIHFMIPETHMLFINGIMGENYGIGTGFAHSLKMAGKGQVIVTCLGDGSFAEGIVYESMTMAKRFNEPVVFFVEDNGFGNSYDSRNFKKGFAAIGKACGLHATTVDGCDVLAVREAMEEAISWARKGEPYLVEAKLVRWGGHFVGDHQCFRDREEEKKAKVNNDPIKRFEAKLYQENILNDELRSKVWIETKAELDEAVEYAMEQEFPGAEVALDRKKVFAQPWDEEE